MFKAVLFDLDNTLIDFMRMKRESCKAAVNAMIQAGLPLSRKKALKQLFRLYEAYGIEFQRIFQEFLKATLKKIDYRLLAKAITAYRKKQASHMIPYASVKPVLKKLRQEGIVLGIVTDAPRMRAMLRLAEMNLIDYFDVIITLGDSKQRKPSKIPFNKAFKELRKLTPTNGIRQNQALFVGDNPARDIKGAKAFGFK
ncbi:HAD-IA family hydrolase, partial [archaeon]|nr:HAD-IA family hydrolase [archaeon]